MKHDKYKVTGTPQVCGLPVWRLDTPEGVVLRFNRKQMTHTVRLPVSRAEELADQGYEVERVKSRK